MQKFSKFLQIHEPSSPKRKTRKEEKEEKRLLRSQRHKDFCRKASQINTCATLSETVSLILFRTKMLYLNYVKSSFTGNQ